MQKIALGFICLLIVSGIMTRDTIWDGIIEVDDDILVPAGVTLTIQPGANIIIKEKDSSENEPLFLSTYSEILIRGKIIARGEKDNPITFSGSGESLWGGIILDNAEDGFFSFCKIQNAFIGIDSLKSSPIIEECVFERNRYAIISSGETSSPKIIKNIITGNYAGVYGIFSSKGKLVENRIENNEEEGVLTGVNSKFTLTNNTISKNKYDIKQE